MQETIRGGWIEIGSLEHPAEAVLLDHSLHRLTVHPGLTSGAAHMAIMAFQQLDDEITFERLDELLLHPLERPQVTPPGHAVFRQSNPIGKMIAMDRQAIG